MRLILVQALMAGLLLGVAVPATIVAAPAASEQETSWRTAAEAAVAAIGGELHEARQALIRDGFSVVDAMVLPDGRLDDVRLMGKSVLPAIDTEWLRLAQGLRLPPLLGEPRRILLISDGTGLKRPVVGSMQALKTWVTWRLGDPGLFPYPPEVRRRGGKGVAKIRFEVTRNGAFVDVALLASSGEPVLDDVALERVKSLTAPPSGDWIGQGASFIVPIQFDLRSVRPQPQDVARSPQADGYPNGPKALPPR